MALNGKAQGNGWLDQAARLAVTHVTPVAKRSQPSLTAAEAEFDAATDDRETVLAEELELTRARATGLERRVAQETAAKQTLSEQFQAADARIAELENELAAAHDELALRDNENESLRTSLDLAMTENAALTERLAKSGAAQHSTGSQLEYLQTALATAETECTRLFSEARDFRIEASTLNDVLATMTSRAEMAERPGLHGKTLTPETLSGADRSIRLWDLASRTTRAFWSPAFITRLPASSEGR